MRTPAESFKQFVQNFLHVDAENIRIVTKDKNDPEAHVLGAVVTLEWGETVQFPVVERFRQRLVGNHVGAEITFSATLVRDPDMPPDEACERAALVIGIDLQGHKFRK